MKLRNYTHFIVGIMLLSTGILLLIFLYIHSKNPNKFNLNVISIIVILGLCSCIYAILNIKKLKRLKRNGKCYEVDSFNVIQVLIPKIRGFHTFYIQCEFKDDMDNLHEVRSTLFSLLKSKKLLIWESNELTFVKKTRIVVYVNCIDFKDYVVKVEN